MWRWMFGRGIHYSSRMEVMDLMRFGTDCLDHFVVGDVQMLMHLVS